MKDHPSELPPIILSSSVNVMDHSVVLKDPGERLKFTLESIDHWLKLSPKIRLVICDGSNYDFTDVLKNHHPLEMASPRIECLHFMNDASLVSTYGKGYGEGEIIRYALENSVMLKNEESFCKCTGKLWVKNFFDCLSEWNGRFLCQAYFSHVFSFKKTQWAYVDTRFYIANKALYEQYFSRVHLQVSGKHHLSIEDIFKKTLIDHQLTGSLFRCHPLVTGVGGASGKYYKDNFVRRNKDRLRLKIVQVHRQFRTWFNSAV